VLISYSRHTFCVDLLSRMFVLRVLSELSVLNAVCLPPCAVLLTLAVGRTSIRHTAPFDCDVVHKTAITDLIGFHGKGMNGSREIKVPWQNSNSVLSASLAGNANTRSHLKILLLEVTTEIEAELFIIVILFIKLLWWLSVLPWQLILRLHTLHSALGPLLHFV
jgi:hypothetical protein